MEGLRSHNLEPSGLSPNLVSTNYWALEEIIPPTSDEHIIQLLISLEYMIQPPFSHL